MARKAYDGILKKAIVNADGYINLTDCSGYQVWNFTNSSDYVWTGADPGNKKADLIAYRSKIQ